MNNSIQKQQVADVEVVMCHNHSYIFLCER